MPIYHRIFISFAIEDSNLRTMLAGQAKLEHTPFEFVDMSVKEPWDERWKSQCRSRIKGCDAMIAVVTSNLINADGALWEIRCAKEERVPVMGIFQQFRPAFIPSDLRGCPIVVWTWDNISDFLRSL